VACNTRGMIIGSFPRRSADENTIELADGSHVGFVQSRGDGG
jgi:hypothetical protein